MFFIDGYLYGRSIPAFIVFSLVFMVLFKACDTANDEPKFTSHQEVIELVSQVVDLQEKGKIKKANDLLESKKVNSYWLFQYSIDLKSSGHYKESSEIISFLTEIDFSDDNFN